MLSIEGDKTSEPSLEEWQQTVAELKQVGRREADSLSCIEDLRGCTRIQYY